jgi:small subunit ribosomal protein S21
MATNCVVIVGRDELADSALKRLKGQLLKAGVFKELKKRGHYEKPSIRKRRKQSEARKKAAKRQNQYAVRDIDPRDRR